MRLGKRDGAAVLTDPGQWHSVRTAVKCDLRTFGISVGITPISPPFSPIARFLGASHQFLRAFSGVGEDRGLASQDLGKSSVKRITAAR